MKGGYMKSVNENRAQEIADQLWAEKFSCREIQEVALEVIAIMDKLIQERPADIEFCFNCGKRVSEERIQASLILFRERRENSRQGKWALGQGTCCSKECADEAKRKATAESA